MATHYLLLLLLVHLLVVCLIPSLTTAADSINQTQSIRDGDTIVSSGGLFKLGFFSPGSSTARYVGIWYGNIPIRTVVWVANRDRPINDSSGVLMFNTTGNLILLGQNRTLVWSASSTRPAQNTILQLLDSGNLVLTDGKDYLWQSFDYPSDTFLPGMKLGKDLQTGHTWSITSWKSPDDPSPGDISWGIENLNLPELIGRRDSIKYFRSGAWTGFRFSGTPKQIGNDLFTYGMVSNQEEVYYAYQARNGSPFLRATVNNTNSLWERWSWSQATQSWRVFFSTPKDVCDTYGYCGVYAKCQLEELPYCQCLKGFTPRFPDKWASNDWTGGCVRNEQLRCGNTTTSDGFNKYPGLKLPDAANTSVYGSLDLKECRDRCLRNCNCMAYTNSHIDELGRDSGCVMWFSDVIDIREVDGGQDLYVRVPASEIAKNGYKAWKIAVIVLAAGAAASMLAVLFYIRKARRNSKDGMAERPNDDLEFPSFDLATIAKATSNFSLQNKLGEGGFGPVYKGVLPDGREIAVKRLSSSSTQGANEFRNEVILIANLQHRNLVKLLGCCIQGEERMLIYEYMPNGSLDAIIFGKLTDEAKGKLLDWRRRFHVICGVARGLVYLHQDSRFRIIHRDLKASNVLLDNEMNPKISDFGMARLFGGDETEGSTKRVVGTYGYMAPEYAIDGLFSVKSDVFSYGILVLEIISGRRNRGFYHLDHNLIGYAWRLYKEGRPEELIDPSVVGICSTSEVLRCIHIALLCLQEHAEDRPSMASVVVMLSSDGSLPLPRRPRFLADRRHLVDNSSSSDQRSCSNEISVSLIEAR